MKVLVLGGTGLVGSALVRALERTGMTVDAPGRDRFEATGTPLSRLFLDGSDAVVNAIVAKDAEAPAAETVNALFPRALGRACADAGVPLVHLSTDGVFSPRGGPHDEAKRPDATDAYGRQKAAGEPPEALVLRFSVIGPGRPGLLEWLRGRKGRVTGFTNHLWNGLCAPALAEAVARILAEGRVRPGPRHLFTDTVSKADLLGMLAEAYRLPVEIERAQAPEPRDQRLSTLHPDFLAGLALPPLARQIAEMAEGDVR